MKRIPVIDHYPWQPNVKARSNHPLTSEEGDRYIVGPTPNPSDPVDNPFQGKANHIATRYNSQWMFDNPEKGWRAFVESDDIVMMYDGSDWIIPDIQIDDATYTKIELNITHNEQTTFTVPSVLSEQKTFVVLNGIHYTPPDDYTVTGTTLTWEDNELEEDDELIFYYLPL